MLLKGRVVSKSKIICLIICLAAIAGFFLPVVAIDISFMQFSMGISLLNIVSMFTESGTQLNGLDLSDYGMDIGVFEDYTMVIVLFAVFYFLTLVFLIITFVRMSVSKSKKSGNITAIISLVLYIGVGISFSVFREAVFSSIEDSLGFISSFFNISDMIQIGLGTGYLITITAIICLLLTKTIMYCTLPKKTDNK